MKLRLWSLRIVAVVLVLTGTVALAAWLSLRASLPMLDGEQAVEGLSAAVQVERDALGSVSLSGSGELDLVRAMGFVHAQERFFEMDLSRRRSAGELAELFGPAALPLDRSSRVHRFRARAERALLQLPETQRALLSAYADGVNAGLAALGARPLAYLLVRQEPREWVAEDSLLVGYSMYLMLQHSGVVAERQRMLIHTHLPASAASFLIRAGTDWDAPLQGEPMPSPAIPSAAEFDARGFSAEAYEKVPETSQGLGISATDPALPGLSDPDRNSQVGSNSFAVGGALSEHGAGIIANDMHLGHGVPNIWFRMCLSDAESAITRTCGVSLPGLPGIVSGSNGHIAWGYTNSYGDWFDYVELALDDQDEGHYLTADGPRPFDVHQEIIQISGAEAESMEVRETVWGPVIEGGDLPPLALRWVAHLPESMNLGLSDMAKAQDIDQALAAAQKTGMPAQNLLVVDRQGRMAWALIGPIPARIEGYDPAQPVPAPAPTEIWTGWLAAEQRPALIDPPEHRLWTANNRITSGQALAILGDGGYALGARANQIRDRLQVRERFTETDLRAIQLDDQALFLESWWHLLSATLDRADDAKFSQAQAVAGRWNRRAGVESAAYRLVRAFRLKTHERVLAPFAVAIREDVEDFVWPRLPQAEGAVWQLLQSRPAHLLGSPWQSYDALLIDAAAAAIDELSEHGDLAEQTWGKRNTSAISHPLSRAVPALSLLLDMPAQPLPGDSNMPRVQGPAFGASERLVVAPGFEEQGLFHMPGGQSGHPLSPFYGSGHEDWAEGNATPFLPGASEHQLTLRPQQR